MKNPGTFLGRKMSQTPRAISMWDNILGSLDFKRILEFGTTRGVLSQYFLLFCKERGAQFYTYDIKDWGMPTDVREHFHHKDIFTIEEEIGNIIKSPGLTVVFCDNGNKIKELRTFSPYLKPRDIIAVHDWKTEVIPEEAYAVSNLKEVYIRESKEDGMTRFFRKHD